MASKNAKRAADKVLEKIGKGERIVLGHILREVGYAEATADNPKVVTETQTFKSVVNPVIQAMEAERNRIMAALAKKKHDKEKYRDLIDGMDKLTKNIQLLSGKETERAGVTVNLVSYADGNSPPQV